MLRLGERCLSFGFGFGFGVGMESGIGRTKYGDVVGSLEELDEVRSGI